MSRAFVSRYYQEWSDLGKSVLPLFNASFSAIEMVGAPRVVDTAQWRVQREELIVFALASSKQRDLTRPPGLFINRVQEASNCLRAPLSALLPRINCHLAALSSSIRFCLKK